MMAQQDYSYNFCMAMFEAKFVPEQYKTYTNETFLIYCFKDLAKLTLNRTHCDVMYPLTRDLGYWKLNDTSLQL